MSTKSDLDAESVFSLLNISNECSFPLRFFSSERAVEVKLLE